MTVRLAAQWKPPGSRPAIKPESLPPGFSPGGGGMPFPGMGGGPPIAFGPGPGMPEVMAPPMPMNARPAGALMRGPDGGPLPPGAEGSRRSTTISGSTNAEATTNSSDSAKPAAVEEPKKSPE